MRNNKDQRFKIEGKIWFGNKEFYLEKITVSDDKEEIAKEKFFEEGWKKAKMDDMDSLSLLLQKYLPVIDAKIIEKKDKQEKTENWFTLKGESIGGDSKKLFLGKVIENSKAGKVFYNKIMEYSSKVKRRIEEQSKNFENQGYKVILNNYKLKTSSRLVVGLGSGHVLETSLTLHHIFGIPYIPASALKGVVRMVSFWEIAEKENKKTDKEIEELQKLLYDEEISNSDKDDILRHKLLFGTQNFKGLLIFLDAYPEIKENQNIFELDVMTPHYQGYYTQNKPPGDWENPNPIVFLTIKKGINFCFNVLFDEFRAKEILNDKDFPQKAKDMIKKIEFSDLTEDVKNWLDIALKNFGVGAKTRLGYGIFE